ncbi:MAG: helix-turn-helix domain-containing protein [Anaerovoracaceae bacterium]
MTIAESNRPVAENLDAIITERALSRPEIARRAGINPRRLYDIIKGHQLIRAQEIKILSEVLGIEVSVLFWENKPEADYIL